MMPASAVLHQDLFLAANKQAGLNHTDSSMNSLAVQKLPVAPPKEPDTVELKEEK